MRTTDPTLDDQARVGRWLDRRLAGAVPAPDQPFADWAVVVAEMCADRLFELADELSYEASHGGDDAVALAIAANVLRDRAFEELAGTGRGPQQEQH